jgi:regulator of sirC expression with transglutaminase-like and TPR domain
LPFGHPDAKKGNSYTIKLTPENADAYYLRGLAYGSLGNRNQEIADMKIAARLGDKGAQDYLRKQGFDW